MDLSSKGKKSPKTDEERRNIGDRLAAALAIFGIGFAVAAGLAGSGSLVAFGVILVFLALSWYGMSF